MHVNILAICFCMACFSALQITVNILSMGVCLFWMVCLSEIALLTGLSMS